MRFLAPCLVLLALASCGDDATMFDAAAPDLSTPDLIRLLTGRLCRRAHLFPVPAATFALLRPLPIIGPPLARLTLSLQVDDAVTRSRLNWRPAVSAQEGLTATARAFAGR